MKNLNKNNSQINESLNEGDLKWLVYDTVMLDMHKTKLGEDKDYIVLAIPVKDKSPADDLATFIEHGVAEFEDVEVSPATDDQGRYLVYVEFKRSPEVYKNIADILSDSKRLCEIEAWKFLHKVDAEPLECNEENFNSVINTDPTTYGQTPEEIEQAKVEETIKARYKFLLNY
jgi:hypothetical protein